VHKGKKGTEEKNKIETVQRGEGGNNINPDLQ
jgi:hypothetical protein